MAKTAVVKKEAKLRTPKEEMVFEKRSLVEIVFDGRSRDNFLSNYFIEPDGTHVQGEFQAAKCEKPKNRAEFAGLTPERAKALGHRVKIRPDWPEVKVDVMKQLVRQKFLDHPFLLDQLLATGTAQLVKRSSCTESGWGMDAHGEGRNMLGKILMEVRAEFQK